MTEPTYEYVKGQGWVPVDCPPDCDIVVHLSGERSRLEYRKPKIGEHFTFHNQNWSREDWKVWARIYSSPRDMNTYRGGRDDPWTGHGPVWWVTVVPL